MKQEEHSGDIGRTPLSLLGESILRPTGPKELLSGKLRGSVLREQLIMHVRNEERVSGG